MSTHIEWVTPRGLGFEFLQPGEFADDNGNLAVLPPVPGSERVTAIINDDGELACPLCGGTIFGYAEGCMDYRSPGGQRRDEHGGEVTVYSHADGTADSGDSDPGLFCDDWLGEGCHAAIDLPEGWEIDFQ